MPFVKLWRLPLTRLLSGLGTSFSLRSPLVRLSHNERNQVLDHYRMGPLGDDRHAPLIENRPAIP